jgi:hypothetical protein
MTLWAMHALYAPVTLASKALRRYLDSGEIPELPMGYTDRAGRLMADVQYAVGRLDATMRSLGELASTDHLTGIYNRRAAEGRLAEDIARAQRGAATWHCVVIWRYTPRMVRCQQWRSRLYSPKCVEQEFSEIRNTKQRLCNRKDTLSG